MILAHDEATLRTRLHALIEAGTLAIDPGYGYWQSGVYSVVDCVFSAQAKYESMVLPMLRDRLPARSGMQDRPELSFSRFIEDVDSFAPDRWDGYGAAVLNLQVLAGRRKVEVCHEIACFFVERGLETIGDLKALAEPALLELILGPLQGTIHGIGPALARYLAILFGIESQVKPDRMMLRLFDALSDWSPRLGNDEDIAVIERVVTRVAEDIGTTPARLDNAIWQLMSGPGGGALALAGSAAGSETGYPAGNRPAVGSSENPADSESIALDESPETEAVANLFRRVRYEELNSKQKESYNFQKLAAELADYGFTCMKLHDDWEGADFLAVHLLGESVLKVQLKGRLTIDKKYLGKALWIAFPQNGAWYLVEHDRLVELVGELTPWLTTQSWMDGHYSSAKPSKKLLQALRDCRV